MKWVIAGILLAIAAKYITNKGENETIFFFTPTSQYNLIQFPDREKRGIFKQIYAQVIFFLTEKERKQFLIRIKKDVCTKKVL